MSLVLDSSVLKNAIRALYAFLDSESSSSSSSSSLLNSEDEQFIYLVVALKKVPTKTNNKPLRIAIPHRIFCLNGNDGCVISKDPSDSIADALKSSPVEGISKVLGVSKLRSDYGQYADKRDLCAAYDLFFADMRVIPLLPALLGKTFFEKKKQPVPVILSKKDIQAELRKARDSTYFFPSKGATHQIKIGRRAFPQAHILENLVAVVNGLNNLSSTCAHGNIQALFIKAAQSIAIPIFQSAPTRNTENHTNDMDTEDTHTSSVQSTQTKKGDIAVSSAKKRKADTHSPTPTPATQHKKSLNKSHNKSKIDRLSEADEAIEVEQNEEDDDANPKSLRAPPAKKLKASLPAGAGAGASSTAASASSRSATDKAAHSAPKVVSQLSSNTSKENTKVTRNPLARAARK